MCVCGDCMKCCKDIDMQAADHMCSGHGLDIVLRNVKILHLYTTVFKFTLMDLRVLL